MKSLTSRVIGIVIAVAIVAVAITFYVSGFLRSPTPIAAGQIGPGQAQLTLGTTPAVGKLGGNPTWVSFLVREGDQWKHTTNFDVPAHSLVKVTVDQYDGQSGLRNPFLSQVQGTVGGVMTVDGQTMDAINPQEASHTFAVPQLGILVPLPGVADDAPNQCAEMPCTLDQAHKTITFTIRTGEKGRYRWQCFVPCAAGFNDGFGGPMQTIGYMDGFVHVV
ncbi:MAG: hypothetical protein QOD60_1605 [Solirubrobacterales bacterium]|jgi:hypothetical protein|nr:hypothetical protein [Solirubrobacterales bacterium]